MNSSQFRALSWAQRLYMMGHRDWLATYGSRPNDDGHAAGVVATNVEGLVGELGDSGEVHYGALAIYLLSATRWVDGACRTITTSDKYFSAMAATRIGSDAAEELRVPWPAFVVEIPHGLLQTEDGREYRHALVAQFKDITIQTEDGQFKTRPLIAWLSLHTDETEESCPFLHSMTVGSVADLLFNQAPVKSSADGGVYERFLDSSDGERGALAIARTAIAGLLFTMQHTVHFKRSAFPVCQRGQLRDSPPPHRVVVVGRPLAVDCRDAVRERAGGHRSSVPSVQTLVRGHVKRQVVGVGRSGRKVIWVEPYWRGPENAPILARPYAVGRA